MKESGRNRPIPEVVIQLGTAKECFLDDSKTLEEQRDKYNKAVSAIWNISSMFYPLGRTGDTTFQVSSDALLKTNIVSNKVKERIRSKARNGSQENRDFNIVTINRTDSGFDISEVYVKEEYYSPRNKGKDKFKLSRLEEDVVHLEKDKNEIRLKIERRMNGLSVNIDGIHMSANETKLLYKDVEPTVTDVNRTLFLLVEGVAPGYFR